MTDAYSWEDIPQKEPTPPGDYEGVLTVCPHQHLFGVPNGMDRDQLRDHSHRCVHIEGENYRVASVRRLARPTDDWEGFVDEETPVYGGHRWHLHTEAGTVIAAGVEGSAQEAHNALERARVLWDQRLQEGSRD